MWWCMFGLCWEVFLGTWKGEVAMVHRKSCGMVGQGVSDSRLVSVAVRQRKSSGSHPAQHT